MSCVHGKKTEKTLPSILFRGRKKNKYRQYWIVTVIFSPIASAGWSEIYTLIIAEWSMQIEWNCCESYFWHIKWSHRIYFNWKAYFVKRCYQPQFDHISHQRQKWIESWRWWKIDHNTDQMVLIGGLNLFSDQIYHRITVYLIHHYKLVWSNTCEMWREEVWWKKKTERHH